MKKKQHITAFYLETLLMIVVFIAIILVLTRVFGSARVQSTQAKRLTAAVTLAQNAAEAVAAAQTPQDLLEILEEDGNAVLQEDAASGTALVTAAYDGRMNPVPIALQDADRAEAGAAGLLRQGADLIVEATWAPGPGEDAADGGPAGNEGPEEESGAPAESSGSDTVLQETSGDGMVGSVITVFDGHTGKAIYTLRTAVYIPDQE